MCPAEQLAYKTPIRIASDKPVAIDFKPIKAKYVRLAVRASYKAAPCLDELEVFGANKSKNLALASAGAKPSASSCYANNAFHKAAHLNDDKYGNSHSWIPAAMPCWAQVELARPELIERVVFSRDRTGIFKDRIPCEFEVLVSTNGKEWTTVRRLTGLGDFPAQRKIPGESRENWAVRVSSSLPGFYRDKAMRLATAPKGPKDIEAVFAIQRAYQQQKDLVKTLQTQFNPTALRRAHDDLVRSFPGRYKGVARFEEKLAAMEKLLEAVKVRLASGNRQQQKKAADDAGKIIDFTRQVLLSNPLLDFEDLLVLKRKLPDVNRRDVYWLWGQQYGFTVNWSCDFRPKNPPVADWWDESLEAIPVKRPAGSGNPSRTIFKARAKHMLQHPELDWDAGRISFSMPGPKGAFQVWEINADGSGLRQLTRETGSDIDNGDPCYLPDGRIIFNSTRMFSGVPCEDGRSFISNLCLMDADGNNQRMLCFDQESNWHPSLLNNGRVLYTRYEYANIGHQFGRLLFQMNPDGSGQMEYYGSNSYWPNSVFHARAVPGHPTKVAGIVCGHHGSNKQGRLVIFDPALGRHETEGAVQAIPGWGKPVERIVEDELYHNDWPKFIHPWPLSEKYFLVSARLSPNQKEYRVYLVDVFDNILEIGRADGYSLMDPIPFAPRPRPPQIPDRVIPGETEATVFLSDVYRGPGLKDVPRGKVKQLRLFTYNYMYRHMIFRGFGHLATAGADGPWEPRHLLGTVPVAEDGSAMFTVPANTPILWLAFRASISGRVSWIVLIW